MGSLLIVLTQTVCVCVCVRVLHVEDPKCQTTYNLMRLVYQLQINLQVAVFLHVRM